MIAKLLSATIIDEKGQLYSTMQLEGRLSDELEQTLQGDFYLMFIVGETDVEAHIVRVKGESVRSISFPKKNMFAPAFDKNASLKEGIETFRAALIDMAPLRLLAPMFYKQICQAINPALKIAHDGSFRYGPPPVLNQ